jgi:rod shape-determining protein MreD
VLVLNNIQFSGFVNPYLYILFLITLPCNTSRELVLFLGFLLGISIDIFSNTQGIHATATVFAAFSRFYLLRAFAPRDDYDERVPSIASFGLGNFFRYALFMVLIHHTVLFMIDFFSFHTPLILFSRILFSSIFTLLLLMGVERFKTK